MTDEQINQRIAEVCGWTEVKKFDWLFGIPPHNAGVFCRVHNYAGCLNAMHDAEGELNRGSGYHETGGYGLYLVALDHDVSATAAQRAEAFLRTIGKWEGEA